MVEVSARIIFGYALFFVGIILLGYVTISCILLANGTVQPLKIEIKGSTSVALNSFLGIMTQIGAYALVVVVASILMRQGFNIAKS